ncbi:SDR family oxidoreductase [bacterium]|nr:SDR family oxidoreductase [bacterium]
MTERTVSHLFDLTGRVALVTGGCGHLGSAMCRGLAEAGASVVVTSRTAEKAATFAATLPARGAQRHLGLALDHIESASITTCVQLVLQEFGSIDVLVNNAHEPVGHDWTNITPEEFTQQLANATGYFTLAKAVRDQAVERQRPASVVLLGSMYGLVGSYPSAYEDLCVASPVAYHALKGGVIQMTRHLAVYWAKDHIRVNCLSPGPFPAEKAPAELVARLQAKSPMQRMGQPDELKGAVVFLASDASSYMTGQNVVIDGGWTAW